MQLRRWISVFVITAIVVAAIVYGFMPKPLAVDTVKVVRLPLEVTVEEEGTTRVADRYVLSAPVAGFMRRITLEVGDWVSQGQIVTELESVRSDLLDPRSRATAQAAVATAASALKAEEERERGAGADAAYGSKNLERSKRLFADGVIAQDTLEQIETAAQRSQAALRTAQAAVKAARSELERARAVLGYWATDNTAEIGSTVAIVAPAAGRLLKIHRESEGIVQPGEPLVDIGDPHHLEVKVEVLSTDAVRIRPGTSVLFTRWGGEAPLAGRVRIVEPAGFTKISSLGVEEQRVVVIADLIRTGDDELHLGDGFRLEASFTLWEGRQVMQVPASALFRVENGWAVFVIENGRAVLRKVDIGHKTGLAVEIRSGLQADETVISHPDNATEAGRRVQPR